jgi:hypothetical protein
MQISEARQIVGIEGNGKTLGLDDKDESLVADRKSIAAVGIRAHDVAAVRDKNVGYAGIVGLARSGTERFS